MPAGERYLRLLGIHGLIISPHDRSFTLEPLARLAGFGQAGTGHPGHEETVARLRLAEAGLARLNDLAENGAAPDAVIDRDTEPEAVPERELRADLIAAENAELSRLFDEGTISAATPGRLQRNLDLEVTRLAERPR
jgi:hypothetical protein